MENKKIAVIVAPGGRASGKLHAMMAALAELGHAVSIVDHLPSQKVADKITFDDWQPKTVENDPRSCWKAPDRRLFHTVDYCSPKGLKALFTRGA